MYRSHAEICGATGVHIRKSRPAFFRFTRASCRSSTSTCRFVNKKHLREHGSSLDLIQHVPLFRNG
uniref:Uncharacterized protein n=1 Tax=Arundo donax TaxID=35708 RepID=A0A0A9F3I4_ARUDO